VSYATGRTAAAFFEKFTERLPAGGESWREAEEQAGEERDCQSEAENAKVERDFLNARKIGRSGRNEEVDQHCSKGEAATVSGESATAGGADGSGAGRAAARAGGVGARGGGAVLRPPGVGRITVRSLSPGSEKGLSLTGA